MSSTIYRILALAYITTVAQSVKEFESKLPFIHADLTSLENFQRHILSYPTHSHQHRLNQRVNGTIDNETSEDKGKLVFFVSPLSFLPLAIFMDHNGAYKIATFDFNSKLTTFALPLLLRGVSNVHKPSSEMAEAFNSTLTHENKFKCHSFLSDDFSCFKVKKSDKCTALYVKVVQKFNMLSMAEVEASTKRIRFSESKAMMLPVGFEYSETGQGTSLLMLKDVVGIAPVKGDNGKMENTFLQTAFAHTENKNYKITSVPVEHVRIWVLGDLPYDIIESSFEVGVEDKLEDYQIVGDLHQESKDNGGKFYVNVDNAMFGGERVEGISKMQYNPSFPGLGFPKRIVDEMMKSTKYKMDKLGGRFYVIYMDLDDSSKLTMDISGKTLEIVVSDALGTWKPISISAKEIKAVIFVEVIPEEDTIELGYLPIRRYSILVDAEEQKMGFKLDN